MAGDRLRSIFSTAIPVPAHPGAPHISRAAGHVWDLMGHQQCNLQARLAGEKETGRVLTPVLFLVEAGVAHMVKGWKYKCIAELQMNGFSF